MASMLEQLELQVADRLLANPFFAAIEVHVDPQKNIVAEVTRKIALMRFLVAPLVAAAGVKNPDENGPAFDPIKITIGIFGNPSFKLSSSWDGVTERDIAEEIVSQRGLHHWKPDCLSTVLYPDSGSVIEQIPDKTLNNWQVNFVATGGLTRELTKLATPAYDAGAGTITCATPGAAVFYTTDGKNPGTASALASGNLGLGAGLTVKARAWLAGWLTSDLLTFTS